MSNSTLPNRTPQWTNKGSNPMPDWLEPHVAGRREPNGSFLIRTRIGRETASARVHVGSVALVVDDIAHTCAPDELPSLLLALERAAEAPPPPKVIQQVRRNAKPKPKAAAAPKPVLAEKARTYPEPIGDPPSIEWIKVDNRIN